MKNFLYKFDITNQKRCNAIVYVNIWQKPDGEFYVKITKRKLTTSFGTRIEVGDKNSYGHVLIDSIKQYIELSNSN